MINIKKYRIIKNKKRLANYIANICNNSPKSILFALNKYEIDGHLLNNEVKKYDR